MAAALVSLHVASHAKSFTASDVGALERLLAGVTVTVNAQTAGSREGLVASRAHVSVRRLRESRLAACADIVVMLPRVGSDLRSQGLDVHRRREVRRQRPLSVDANWLCGY